MKKKVFSATPLFRKLCIFELAGFILDAIPEATLKGFASSQNSDPSHLK